MRLRGRHPSQPRPSRATATAEACQAGRGLALRDVLHRHRIQIGALVTINPELTRLALDVAETAGVTPADTNPLRRFMEMLSVYGNTDLRADLQLVVGALRGL